MSVKKAIEYMNKKISEISILASIRPDVDVMSFLDTLSTDLSHYYRGVPIVRFGLVGNTFYWDNALELRHKQMSTRDLRVNAAIATHVLLSDETTINRIAEAFEKSNELTNGVMQSITLRNGGVDIMELRTLDAALAQNCTYETKAFIYSALARACNTVMQAKFVLIDGNMSANERKLNYISFIPTESGLIINVKYKHVAATLKPGTQDNLTNIIGDVPLTLNAAILQFIQSGDIQPLVAAHLTLRSDMFTRVISAQPNVLNLE